MQDRLVPPPVWLPAAQISLEKAKFSARRCEHSKQSARALLSRRQCRGLGWPLSWAYPVVIVVDVKALVGVDENVLVILCLLGWRAHEAPHWQIIYEELIPACMEWAIIQEGHRLKLRILAPEILF